MSTNMLIDIPFIEEQYAVAFKRPEQPMVEYSFVELTKPETIRSLMETYAGILKASDITPAATYFASWLRGMSITAQLLMSVHDAALDWSIQNWTLLVSERDGRMSFAFHPVDAAIVSAPSTDRAAWRDNLMNEFYSTTLRPLIDAVSGVTGVHSAQLWALMASGMYYYREHQLGVLGEGSSGFSQVEADYRYVMQEMKGEVFGRSRNPLAVKFRLVENPRNKQEKIPLKASCCLAYLTEGHGYCYTCPKLSESQRLEKGRELAAKAAKS